MLVVTLPPASRPPAEATGEGKTKTKAPQQEHAKTLGLRRVSGVHGVVEKATPRARSALGSHKCPIVKLDTTRCSRFEVTLGLLQL